MTAADLLDDLASHGRYHFSTTDAGLRLGGSAAAARAALRRLRKKGWIAAPYRSFHVIVPPEYRTLGCLPPEQFIPELMAHLGEPYYVGLLSAAEFHGAAHHRPQEFQVVTAANRSALRCGRVRVAFVARHNAGEIPVVTFNTPRGVVRVASPETTALDVVGYPRHGGGLDNVATVLAELAEVLDPEELARVAARTSPTPWAQRLGFLLERVGAGDRCGPLAALVAERATHVTPLSTRASMRGAPRDERWRLAVNVEVEADV